MHLFAELQTRPGAFLVVLICATMLVVGARLAYEKVQAPKSHGIILAGAFFAAAMVYRVADILAHPGSVRWSATLGAAGLLVFLASDPCVAQHYGTAWRAFKRALRGRRGAQPDEEARPWSHRH